MKNKVLPFSLLFVSIIIVFPLFESTNQALAKYDEFENYKNCFKVSKIENLVDTKISDVYLWKGDITTLKVDAIVNAANKTLRGGGGVDGAVHRAAGKELLEECIKLNGCKTGEAKITLGYRLPCKYIIHTVGPIVRSCLTQKDCDLLASCYNSCLKLADEHSLDSIAFCCISTGIYNFPNDKAAQIAVESVEKYKVRTKSQIKVIFNVFTEKDESIYRRLLV